MLYLANAFSLSMLGTRRAIVDVQEIDLERARYEVSKGFESAVGHESTAKVMSALLGVEVPARRVAIKLLPGDTLLVFQLLTRLPEGKVLTEEEIKELPHKWFLVRVS